jgi:hypothetical protein
MKSIINYFTKHRTAKVFILVSITAIFVCAFYYYSIAIMCYAAEIAQHNNEHTLVKKEEKSIKERIAIVSPEYKELLWNLAKCESRFNEFAVGINKGSIDRGVFQINNKFQKEVNDECAFNVECSTRWAVNEIKNGGLHQWACKTKI